VVDLGPLSPEEEQALEEELDHGALAHTGDDVAELVLVGLVVLLVGAGLVEFTRRRGRAA
jgi:LPXTG-motif cell wall-anchored protein